MISPPLNILDLPLEERAPMDLKEAVDEVIEDRVRAGLPLIFGGMARLLRCLRKSCGRTLGYSHFKTPKRRSAEVNPSALDTFHASNMVGEDDPSMLLDIRYHATTRKSPGHVSASVALTFTFAALLLTAVLGYARQQNHAKSSMPGMDMSSKEDMSNMGPSMAAMAGHMYITPLRPKEPGDEEKAKAVVAEVKAAIEHYKDYRKALADGYVIANPSLKQPQYHFMNKANTREADLRFEATKPTALLYRRTPMLEYKLEGVMFTANPDATEDELNQRVPLSVARWHRHMNFCAAPDDRAKDYRAAHPKFGMFGSINTKEACEAEGGTFHAQVFTWMLHIFPYEADFKEVFSLNDDVAHVH